MHSSPHLSHSKSLCGLLEQSIPVCMVKTDALSRIVFCNDRTLVAFGFTQKWEVCQLRCQDLLADPGNWAMLLEKLKQERTVRGEKLLLRRKNGTNFWGLVSLRYYKRMGGVHYEIVILDISEQVAWEQMMNEKTALLEKATTELDRIIYSASHDLRSPISSILGLVNLLRISFEGNEKLEYVDHIEKSVKRLDDFVKKLSDFSRNANEAMRDERIDFDYTIQKLNQKLLIHPNYQKVRINSTIKQSKVFYSDPNRILLILLHLYQNILDFYDFNKPDPHGLIQIDVFIDSVKINFFDNGIGIPQTRIHKIFDMFYRGTDRSMGSGIGLFIVKETLAKLKGKIELHSEYGIGTSVNIEIPNSIKGKLINKKNILKVSNLQGI